MANKNTPISLKVTLEVKDKLIQKSRELNLTLTGYLEKIAAEPIVFLDKNLKKVLSVVKANIDII